jgi:predicted deacylase
LSAANLPAHAIEIQPPDLSRWAESTSGAAYVQEMQSGQPGAEVLLCALVHGNEFSGAMALDELLCSNLKISQGRVTVVFANIQAFSSFDIRQPDASRFVDQDFNRIWNAALLESATQHAELRRARQIRPFLDRATHLLDLHSMHEPCEPLLITGTLARNVQFAQSLGSAKQVVMDAGHQDGTRMRDYGDFGHEGSGKIALLLEAGQHWQSSSVAASRDVLLRFLLRSGVITPKDVVDACLQAWLAEDHACPLPVEVTHAVVARSMRFEFTDNFTGNQLIAKAGTIIATNDNEPVATPYDDCVLVMPSVRQLRPGVTTVRLGRRVAV